MKKREPATTMVSSANQLGLLVDGPHESYRQIRDFLAGRLVGATRDESLLQVVIKCLFCKAMLARRGIAISDDPETLLKEYSEAFEEVQTLLPEYFDSSDELQLDAEALAFVDAALGFVDFGGGANDPFGDAYEAFLGSAVRGQEGQFFTPRNAVDLLVSVVDPVPGEKVIDPACGSGTFLSVAGARLLEIGATPEMIHASLFGIDKDSYLAKLAAARLSLMTLLPPHIYCGDSLSWKGLSTESLPLVPEGTFDVVLTNPPFGARIKAASLEVQRGFQMGYKWKSVKGSDEFVITPNLASSVPPQVFFIERCMKLLKPGGRAGIVVPESLVSGRSYRHVVHYIREHAEILAVIGMPESLFKTSGKGGTHTKTCLLAFQKKPADRTTKGIFMAEAVWCGKDSRGHKIGHDDLPLVEEKMKAWGSGNLEKQDHLGYQVRMDQVIDHVLAPRYYDPEVLRQLQRLKATHEFVEVRSLVESGVLQVTSGHEVGKMEYGTGAIPFIRTSDISNWEIKVDPKHCVSAAAFERLRLKQDVREGDILMVRDGTYLIGTCAFVTQYDTRIVFQSHLYKLRVTDESKLSTYLLLALLSSPPVQRQIKAKRFTQDIIDSLGDRLYELVLPVPKDPALRQRIQTIVRQTIQERMEARELARRARYEVVGLAAPEMEQVVIPDEIP